MPGGARGSGACSPVLWRWWRRWRCCWWGPPRSRRRRPHRSARDGSRPCPPCWAMPTRSAHLRPCPRRSRPAPPPPCQGVGPRPRLGPVPRQPAPPPRRPRPPRAGAQRPRRSGRWCPRKRRRAPLRPPTTKEEPIMHRSFTPPVTPGNAAWRKWRTSRRQSPPSERSQQRGQTLVIFALSLTVLIGFAGLAIDVLRTYDLYAHEERAAEAGALAGVIYMPNFYSAKATGIDNNSAITRALIEV